MLVKVAGKAALGLGLGLALALVGCFSPTFGDGAVACAAGGECPPGLACYEGVCRRDAPAHDAAPVPVADAGGGAGARDAASEPARVYQYQLFGGWAFVPADLFFSGGDAPDPAAVGAAWAHCDGNPILCVATEQRWACTDLDQSNWFDGALSNLDGELAASPPTLATAWGGAADPGFRNTIWFTSHTLWWIYGFNDRPRPILGGLWPLDRLESYEDLDTYDELYRDEPNAPDWSDLTADYADFSGTVWTLWDSVGTVYQLDLVTGVWAAPAPSPLLAEPGAPAPDRVLAAARCADTLFVITRASP